MKESFEKMSAGSFYLHPREKNSLALRKGYQTPSRGHHALLLSRGKAARDVVVTVSGSARTISMKRRVLVLSAATL